jgi:hypothetical protein
LHTHLILCGPAPDNPVAPVVPVAPATPCALIPRTSCTT